MDENTANSRFAFSRNARRFLRAAHWSQRRRIGIEIYEAAYQEEHLLLHPTARHFLARFGGLIIRYEVAAQPDVLDFCADDAVRGMGDGGLVQIERQLSIRPLCPIGQFQDGTCMLLQSNGGCVYGVSDDVIVAVGNSGEAAINNILSGYDLEFIESFVPPNTGPS